MNNTPWHLHDMPDQTGKRALVTGVTSGIGDHTARELARNGAEVILAARSWGKLEETMRSISGEIPSAKLHPLIIDVSDMTSVRNAAEDAKGLGAIDVLVNNAGVMATPYHRTREGFELQLATNHLGPFLLAGLLLPQLIDSGDGRVVSIASQAHRWARQAPLEDPRLQHGHYSRWRAYSQSKLANLLFTYELDRRLRAHGLPVKALAAHPGFAATQLMGNGKNLHGRTLRGTILQAATNVTGQRSDYGALPTLMAATADLPGSTYIGPDGPGQLRGLPRVVGSSKRARSPESQRMLWEVSELATGIFYP